MANEKRLMYVNDFLDLFYVASAGQDKAFIKAVEMVVEDTPTVGAVEVVHGRWIEDYETFVQDNGYESEPIHTGFLCSVCGRHSCSIEPYCHCGAKMDGGNEDGNL